MLRLIIGLSTLILASCAEPPRKREATELQRLSGTCIELVLGVRDHLDECPRFVIQIHADDGQTQLVFGGVVSFEGPTIKGAEFSSLTAPQPIQGVIFTEAGAPKALLGNGQCKFLPNEFGTRIECNLQNPTLPKGQRVSAIFQTDGQPAIIWPINEQNKDLLAHFAN